MRAPCLRCGNQVSDDPPRVSVSFEIAELYDLINASCSTSVPVPGKLVRRLECALEILEGT